jgi:hypothetical protein
MKNQEQWAKQAANKLRRATNQMSRKYPQIQFRLAVLERADGADQLQEVLGTLEIGGHRFGVHVCRGDVGYGALSYCCLFARFDDCYPEMQCQEPFVLPITDAKTIYNVFECCIPPAKLTLIPEQDSIKVCGLDIKVPLDCVTGRVIWGATLNLNISARLVWDRLSKNEGDDYFTRRRRV